MYFWWNPRAFWPCIDSNTTTTFRNKVRTRVKQSMWHPWFNLKGIVHPKIKDSVINYSPACRSKPVRPSFIFRTQILMNYVDTLFRLFRLWSEHKHLIRVHMLHTLFTCVVLSKTALYDDVEEINCWIKSLFLFSLLIKSILVAL